MTQQDGGEPTQEDVAKALQVSLLTTEWIELLTRVSIIKSEKKEFLLGCKKEIERIERRIDEIKSEISSVKSGETVTTAIQLKLKGV
jgi:uncharacterized protein Yka (UPF0111/DUF47 family)